MVFSVKIGIIEPFVHCVVDRAIVWDLKLVVLDVRFYCGYHLTSVYPDSRVDPWPSV